MENQIQQAAHFLQEGQHARAIEVLETLQSQEAQPVAEQTLFLLQNLTFRDATSVHFTYLTLKLLRYALTKNTSFWLGAHSSLLMQLVGFGSRLDDASAQSPLWRPVLAELSTTIAVVLKLGCVKGEDVHLTAVTEVLSWLQQVASGADTAGHACLSRLVCQSVVAEFGVYNLHSCYHGLPMRLHRKCRALFEEANVLPQLVVTVLQQLEHSVVENQTTVKGALSLLVTCLSWFSHRHFEEDSLLDQASDEFIVSGESWARLLTGPLLSNGQTFSQSVCQWFHTSSVRSAAVEPRQLAELTQLLCSYKMNEWSKNAPTAHLLSQFEGVVSMLRLALSSEALLDAAPILANGLLRLVTNFDDELFHLMAHIGEGFTNITMTAMALEAKSNDNEFLMSCLDDLFGAWFHLATIYNRKTFSVATSEEPNLTFLRQGCDAIFSHYLSLKLKFHTEEEYENAFSESFANSHLSLVAHIGRVSCRDSCAKLLDALAILSHQLQQGDPRVPCALTLCEGLWFLFKMTSFFVADSCKGEQPYIPSCFFQMGANGEDRLVHLMAELMRFAEVLFATTAVTSPAVFTVYTDIFSAYNNTYIEAEDSCTMYAAAFEGNQQLVSFALSLTVKLVDRFPFDEDIGNAACRLLESISSKSADVLSFVRAQPVFVQLGDTLRASGSFDFSAYTKGRMLAFVLNCFNASPSLAQCIACMPLLQPTGIASDVNSVLNTETALTGLFAALHQQDTIRLVFPAMLTVGSSFLEAASKFTLEREVVIKALIYVRKMFLCSSPVLSDSEIDSLLHFVVHTLDTSLQVVKGEPSWTTPEGENDKLTFLQHFAQLITTVAQWKQLDCFLADEATLFLATSVVASTASLLSFLDNRTLSMPNLEDEVFEAMDSCAAAFTSPFVSSSQSTLFFQAMRHALCSARSSIQRVGMSTTECIVTALKGSQQYDNFEFVCAEICSMLLWTLLAGQVTFSNTWGVAKMILHTCADLRKEKVDAIFQTVLNENPTKGPVLTSLYGAIMGLLPELHQNAQSASVLEESLLDCILLSRGSLIL